MYDKTFFSCEAYFMDINNEILGSLNNVFSLSVTIRKESGIDIITTYRIVDQFMP